MAGKLAAMSSILDPMGKCNFQLSFVDYYLLGIVRKSYILCYFLQPSFLR